MQIIIVLLLLVLQTRSFGDETISLFDIKGYVQQETAYRIVKPDELTKTKQIFQIGLSHRFNEIAKLRVSGRFFYDAIARESKKTEAVFRETYLDISSVKWNLTLGKQQIVWGEVPGLFFADIVTAKDFREFLLPSFEYIRIPPWAVNFQHYGENNTLQFVWVPILEFDKLPKSGSEFAINPPVPEGVLFIVNDQKKVANSFENSGAGVRWSTILSGWNPSFFYFYQYDHLPTFFRTIESDNMFLLTPKHLKIRQLGYGLSKDFDGFLLKSEGVLSSGKGFSAQDLSSETGVTKKDFLEYVIGGEFFPYKQTTVNLQAYQRFIFNNDSTLINPGADSGISFY